MRILFPPRDRRTGQRGASSTAQEHDLDHGPAAGAPTEVQAEVPVPLLPSPEGSPCGASNRVSYADCELKGIDSAEELCRAWFCGVQTSDGSRTAPVITMKAEPLRYPIFTEWVRSNRGKKYYSFRRAMMDIIETQAREGQASARSVDHQAACLEVAERFDREVLMDTATGKRKSIQCYIEGVRREAKRQRMGGA